MENKITLDQALAIASDKTLKPYEYHQVIDGMIRNFTSSGAESITTAFMDNDHFKKDIYQMIALYQKIEGFKHLEAIFDPVFKGNFPEVQMLGDDVKLSDLYPGIGSDESVKVISSNVEKSLAFKVGDQLLVAGIEIDEDYNAWDSGDIYGSLENSKFDPALQNYSFTNQFIDFSSVYKESVVQRLFPEHLKSHFIENGNFDLSQTSNHDLFSDELQQALSTTIETVSKCVSIYQLIESYKDELYINIDASDREELINAVIETVMASDRYDIDSEIGQTLFEEGKFNDLLFKEFVYEYLPYNAIENLSDKDLITTEVYVGQDGSLDSRQTIFAAVQQRDVDDLASDNSYNHDDWSAAWMPNEHVASSIAIGVANKMLDETSAISIDWKEGRYVLNSKALSEPHIVGNDDYMIANVYQVLAEIKGIDTLKDFDLPSAYLDAIETTTLIEVDSIGRDVSEQAYTTITGSITLPNRDEIATLMKYSKPIDLTGAIDFNYVGGYVGDEYALYNATYDLPFGNAIEKAREAMQARNVDLGQLQDENFDFSENSSEIEETIYNYCPHLPEGVAPSSITGMIREAVDGEIENLWITQSSRPYDLNSTYTKVIDNGQMLDMDQPAFVQHGTYSGKVVDMPSKDVIVISHSGRNVAFDANQIADNEVEYPAIEFNEFGKKVNEFAEQRLNKPIELVNMGYVKMEVEKNFSDNGQMMVEFNATQTRSGNAEILRFEPGVDYQITTYTMDEQPDINVGDKVKFSRSEGDSEWKVNVNQQQELAVKR